MTDLEKARMRINEIDPQLVKLFEERMHAVVEIARYKKENGLPIFDQAREQENLTRNSALLKDQELTMYFLDWYQHMMDVTKEYEKKLLDL